MTDKELTLRYGMGSTAIIEDAAYGKNVSNSGRLSMADC